MTNIIDEIRSLKALAKSQLGQGQYETGAQSLRTAIDTLEAALTHADSVQRADLSTDAEEKRMAEELADLYGMLGGANRKQGDLIQAVAAYDAGFGYESNPRYGIVNTYNALNRLVTRILLCPDSLSDANALRNVNELKFVNVPEALRDLEKELKEQVEGERSDSFWAAGDLAFTCALNEDDQGALDAVQRFKSCSPPSYAYSAYIEWISTIAQLDTPRKEHLNKVKALFENRIH